MSTPGSSRSERSIEDAAVAESIGIAAVRVEERILASTGDIEQTKTRFESCESVMQAGLLFSIPALMSQGLFKASKHYGSWKSGYYGFVHILITLALMALSRIKNPEQLKNCPPGELGKIIGLDRIPQAKCLREKITFITDQGKAREFQNDLAKSWIETDECIYFNIDGHVRVYNGSKANLTKKYVSRQKLCLTGTTEFWVNDPNGLPIMNVAGELKEGLKQSIEQIIPILIEDTKNLTPYSNQKGENGPEILFTIIFDREAYQPSFFKQLFEQKIAIITYRKNVKDRWDENLFKVTDVQVIGKTVSMLICEQEIELDEFVFREVRRLNDGGHQTSVITTNPYIEKEEIAGKMFGRWSQENFFSYMIKDFDIDHIIEYGIETIDENKQVVNPLYSKLSQRIKKCKEKNGRLVAKMYQLITEQSESEIDYVAKTIHENVTLKQKIDEFQKEINKLVEDRKEIPARITLKEMPDQVRYNKLKTESKLFINTIKMIAYRAETALLNQIRNYYTDIDKDGRMLIKQIFKSDANIKPDYENKILNITLHTLSTPRANKAVKQLCDILNETETQYPGTDLVMKFKTLALLDYVGS